MIKKIKNHSNQQQIVKTRDRRIAKGIVIAYSCEIVQIEKETYKVQSETDSKKYYIVKFMDGTPIICDCKDWEFQSKKNPNHICKHMRSIVIAEIWINIKTTTIKIIFGD